MLRLLGLFAAARWRVARELDPPARGGGVAEEDHAFMFFAYAIS